MRGCKSTHRSNVDRALAFKIVQQIHRLSAIISGRRIDKLQLLAREIFYQKQTATLGMALSQKRSFFSLKQICPLKCWADTTEAMNNHNKILNPGFAAKTSAPLWRRDQLLFGGTPNPISTKGSSTELRVFQTFVFKRVIRTLSELHSRGRVCKITPIRDFTEHRQNSNHPYFINCWWLWPGRGSSPGRVH